MSCVVSHTSVDCADAYALSQWWKQVLGYVDRPGDPNGPGDEECWIQRPDGGDPLLFLEVPDALDDVRRGKNRIHLDLGPGGATGDDRRAELLAHGARVLADHWTREGGGWVVLADPEGNELCLLDGTATLRGGDGPAYVECTTVDSRDPLAQARWWQEVLGYVEHPDQPHDPDADEHLVVRPDHGHELLFVAVPEAKRGKNRVHLDLRPAQRRRDDELPLLLAHGARQLADRRTADGGGWVTLADPEGNEFCLLRGPADRDADAAGS